MPLHGECNCGKIKVTVADQPDEPGRSSSITCRCLTCRKQSGGVGTIIIGIPTPEVKIEGETKVWNDNATDSGKPMDRHFCPDCGCPVASIQPEKPEVTYVKMGLFKDIPKPFIEIYVKNKLPWETTAGVVEFPAGPTS